MVEMNFPVERDMDETTGQQSSTQQEESRLFRIQPTKKGQTADNLLFFSLFNPSRFQNLEHWPEDASTWYLKFFVHWVSITDEDSGRERRIAVLCEPSFNKYVKERLTQPQMAYPEPFPAVTTCEFCEKSQEYWDAYRDGKAAAGIENLSTDDFKRVMDSNPQLSGLRTMAKNWAPAESIYFAVLDYKKYNEGNDGKPLRLQAYFGGAKILKGLFDDYKGGFKFFDPTGNTPIVRVTRDTTHGVRYCTYDVRTLNEPANFEEEVIEYILSGDDVPDPFDFMQIWTPGQKLAYVNQCGNSTTDVEENDEQPAPLSEPQETAPPRSSESIYDHLHESSNAANPAPPPKPGIAPRVRVTQSDSTDATTAAPPRRQKAKLSFGGGNFKP